MIADGQDPGVVLVMMRDRYQAAFRQAQERLAMVSRDGARITTNGQLEMVRLTNDMTAPLVEAAVGRKPNPTVSLNWQSLPEEELQAFTGLAGDGSPLEALFDQIPGATSAQMEALLVDGIALGLGPRRVAANISRVAADMPRYRAERIARTEMIRASREASRQLYEQNDAITGYRRMATQDQRVCPGCLALSGTLHQTDEIMPSHPNCRCVMVPETLSWAEIVGDPTIPDTRPKVPDADALFDGLSPEEQRIVLGPARYEAWQNGTNLSDMVQIRQNTTWGPEIRLVPVSQL